MVFLMAYIPVYAHVHPDVLQVKQNEGTEDDIYKAEEKTLNQLSVMMLIWGVVGGVFVLVICSVISLSMEDKLLSLRVGCVVVGVWCIALLTFPVLWMKNRAGPPLPK